MSREWNSVRNLAQIFVKKFEEIPLKSVKTGA